MIAHIATIPNIAGENISHISIPVARLYEISRENLSLMGGRNF
jgi:hypothetical protein